jgi:hypothetical protein
MLHRLKPLCLALALPASSVLHGAAVPSAAPLSAATAAPIERAVQEIVRRHGTAAILVLGELHGTHEAPAVLAGLARVFAARGDLQVGLEIPPDEQDRLDAWLASDGSAAARAALLTGPFWQQPVARSDGRRSEAMLALLEDLRQLRHAHPRLRLLAYSHGGQDEVTRDQAMAQALRRAHLAAPEVKLLVLTGNYHARLRAPSQLIWNGTPVSPPAPMAGQLADLPLATVDLGARAGSFWACQGSCGVQRLPAQVVADDTLTIQVPDPARADYHLLLRLPRYTPAPPVVP